MKRVYFSVLFCLMCGVCPSWGADFSFLLNDDSVQAELMVPLDENQYGDSFADLRMLYNDDEDTLLGTVSGGVKGAPGNFPGLQFGAQILGNAGDSDDESILAVGLGLLAQYQPPQLQGLGAYARAQYAPELLCFLDSEGLTETAIGLSYRILPNATLALEYQNTEIDIEHDDERRIDESVRGGIVFNF
jgi:hypothetical protein